MSVVSTSCFSSRSRQRSLMSSRCAPCSAESASLARSVSNDSAHARAQLRQPPRPAPRRARAGCRCVQMVTRWMPASRASSRKSRKCGCTVGSPPVKLTMSSSPPWSVARWPSTALKSSRPHVERALVLVVDVADRAVEVARAGDRDHRQPDLLLVRWCRGRSRTGSPCRRPSCRTGGRAAPAGWRASPRTRPRRPRAAPPARRAARSSCASRPRRPRATTCAGTAFLHSLHRLVV